MKLKLAIVAANKSQRQVAFETNLLTENRLSEIVNGWVVPRAYEKVALASVLKVPVETLFDNSAGPSGKEDHP